MKHFLVPTLLVLSTGCSDYGINESKDETFYGPTIQVEPSELTFAQATLEEPETLLFTISNVGNALLEIDSMELLGSSTYSFTAVEFPDGLPPEESVDIAVTYTPEDAGVLENGSVYIWNNDPLNATAEVKLLGQLDMPFLSITPNPLDFGAISIEDTATGTFTLASAGQVPVTLNSYEISGTMYSAVESDVWPITLDPGSETLLDVTFEPTVGGVYAETLTVTVEEPGYETTAQLLGEGLEAEPIAVCSVDPTEIAPNSGTVTWLGSSSYDAAGYSIIDYKWNLMTRPGGSTASLPSGGADRSGFQPDLAGEYIARLVVTNELGMDSEPCFATLTATPEEDLWVQMYWAQPGDDMDLHLLRPGGTLQSDDDCYYANCTNNQRDWGIPGDTSDNPSLDLDDISGTGPENINIQSPETGTFTIVVHDHTSNNYPGDNDVTVVIFAGGYQVWTDTRTITGEDTYTEFAEIEWPSGVVTPL